jgi:hypothetical protein
VWSITHLWAPARALLLTLAHPRPQDQLSELLGTAAAQQGLATELANMLAERAALEREYAGRLQAITRKARERRDRRVLEAAVGPEPNRSVSAEEAKDR